MAAQLGVDRTTFGKWERGESPLPRKQLEAFCLNTQSRPDYIIAGAGQPGAAKEMIREEITKYEKGRPSEVALREENTKLMAENAELKNTIAILTRRLFGKDSGN